MARPIQDEPMQLRRFQWGGLDSGRVPVIRGRGSVGGVFCLPEDVGAQLITADASGALDVDAALGGDLPAQTPVAHDVLL